MKVIKTGHEARIALKKGIDLAVDAIKVTLGAAGKNAVLGRVDIPPILTNDGVSIVRNVEAEDEIENQGVWIVKEACSVASGKAGDGTTTTGVLLQAIISEVFERLKDDGSLVKKNINVMDLQREIDAACITIVNQLKDKARPISIDEIYNVAMVAGEFDWLALMVTDMFKIIGKDGYVSVEEGIKTKFETFKGIEINAGYHSEYYADENGECVVSSPHVLVTNNRLDDIAAILPVITELATKGINGLIIIAPDFGKDFLNRLTTAKLKHGSLVVALKLPSFDKNDLLKDVALLTEAKFIDKDTYEKYEDFTADIKYENLGKAEKAIIKEAKTVIIGGNGETSERVVRLKQILEETESAFDKDGIEKRIAFLSGGVAEVKIGGNSDFEKTYFKLKAENAVNAVQIALKDGVVKGGGLALKEVSEELKENILSKAILAPYEQIQTNEGRSFEIPSTVIDPVKTTISSLESACSLAGRVITTEVVIAFKNESKDKN